MTKINNLIFDLDNTLYDFSIIWEKSNKQVYEYLKYDRIASYEEFFKHYKAINNMLVDEVLKGNMKLREIRNTRLKLTLEKFGIILTEEDCNIYYEKQFDFIIESIKPISGNWELIDQAKTRYVYENESYRVYVLEDPRNDGYIVVLARNNWLEMLYL